MKRLLTGRIRLVDGLMIAAVALLLLKGLGYLLSPTESGPDGQRFARVIAHARTNYDPPDPPTTGSVPEKPKDTSKETPTPSGPAASKEPSPDKASSPSERAIYERLGERRDELQQRAREMELREKLIEDGERRLDAKAGEIKAQEERQGGAVAAAAEQEAAALKSLVIMYETMKPKEAARVFERLSHDVLVPVSRLINPRKMAEILAAMSPESAERLTVALARRPRPTPDRAAAASLPPGELQAIEPPARPEARRRP